MPIKNLDRDTYLEAVSQGIVVVDFWAPWCQPCLRFSTVFEAASEEYPDIAFCKVNTEEQFALARDREIMAIPTLMAYRDGILVFRQTGALPLEVLRNLVAKIRSLDMNVVRQKRHEQAMERAKEES